MENHYILLRFSIVNKALASIKARDSKAKQKQACIAGMDFWNVAKGSLNGLKCFFLKKCQNFVLYFYFMSKIVLE